MRRQAVYSAIALVSIALLAAGPAFAANPVPNPVRVSGPSPVSQCQVQGSGIVVVDGASADDAPVMV